MKYYSDFTNEYVQDICNALNNAGFLQKPYDKPFDAKDFKNLTEFIKHQVLYTSSIFEFLNQKGLVNKGRCPFTGQQIVNNKSNYSYLNRTIYLSPEGCSIMQREDDENYKKLFGEPPPKRNNLSANKGCFGLLACIAVIISICIVLLT